MRPPSRQMDPSYTCSAQEAACSVTSFSSLAQQILGRIFSRCRFQNPAEILPLESDPWQFHWIIPFSEFSALAFHDFLCDEERFVRLQCLETLRPPRLLLDSLCLGLINMPQCLLKMRTDYSCFHSFWNGFLGTTNLMTQREACLLLSQALYGVFN